MNAAQLDAGEYWGVPEIAEFLGIAEGTVRDYIADPARKFPEGVKIGGRKVYSAEKVRAWHAERRGQGWRKGRPRDAPPGP